MKEKTRILIASEHVEDARLISKSLQSEFSNVFISTNPDRSIQDFEEHNPSVLVLAFDGLVKAERFYLGLHRRSNLFEWSHRSIALCNKDEVRQAYELCKQEQFDDYVLFWPMTHDTFRLHMAIHHAVRVMASSAGADTSTAGAFAAQVRRMQNLEPLEQSVARGMNRISVTVQAVEQAKEGIGAALDGFYSGMTNAERSHLVEVKDHLKLREEFDRLKTTEINQHFKTVGSAVQSVSDWAGSLGTAIAPRIDAERALQAVATGVRPVILFVDDDELQHELMSKLLENADVTLLGARSAVEARAILRRHRPDVIMMDVNLPEINGIEAVRRIKSIEHLKDIPVVMVTGHSEKSVIGDALKAGAVDFVVKPFRADTVHAKLQLLLNARA